MYMKKALFLLILVSLLSTQVTYAQESNAGFVQGLWYSSETIFVKKPVRIYVAIRNNTGSDLTGTVEFFDGDTRIDKKNVQALNGRIIETWADWTPTYGSHTLHTNLTRTELSTVGSSTQSIETVSALAEDVLFVDYDTDNDNVGNKDDSDDDGDGISDAQESANGTNPLVADAPVIENKTVLTTASLNSSVSEPNTKTQSASSTPVGLEQYLADSPAEEVLASVTNLINTTKENLDTYRTKRVTEQAAQTAAPKVPVNADGFGEITRTTSTDTKGNALPNFLNNGLTSKTAPANNTDDSVSQEGFVDTVVRFIGTLLNTGYTALLAALSYILGHPVFIQFGGLILILFLLIKFAAKFGRRPSNYKK